MTLARGTFRPCGALPKAEHFTMTRDLLPQILDFLDIPLPQPLPFPSLILVSLVLVIGWDGGIGGQAAHEPR